MDRQVYWGTRPDGREVLFLIDFRDDGCHVFLIPKEETTRSFVDDIHKVWKNGNAVPFPKHHDHIVWDLETSAVFPFFSGINRPEDRDRLSNTANREIQRKNSRLYCDILLSEIEMLGTSSSCQAVWNYDYDEVTACWNKTVTLSGKLKEARAKYGQTSGNAWREMLSPRDFETLKGKLDRIFSHLKTVREKHFENAKQAESKLLKTLESELGTLESSVATTKEWKPVRESLKAFKDKVRSAVLNKDVRQTLLAKVDKAFEALSKRQDASRAAFDRECSENRSKLSGELSDLESEVRTTVDWRGVREKLKAAKSRVFSATMKKDQRDELFRRLDEAFERLGNRQSEARSKFESECATSAYVLESIVARCENLARNSTDWRDSREEFKAAGESVRQRTLKKETRSAFLDRVSWCFRTLGDRQDADRRQYESECSDNYRRLSIRLSNALDSIACGTDYPGIRSSLFEIRDDLKSSRLTKDQRDELFGKLNDRFDRLKTESDRHYENKRREFQERRNEALSRLRNRLSNLTGSISHDEGVLADKEYKYDNVRSGPKYHEIRDSIYSSITSLRDKIASKKDSVREIERKISDIESGN